MKKRSQRRSGGRLETIVVLALLTSTICSGADTAVSVVQRFDIPAQSTSDALNAFSKQSGLRLLFSYDAVEGKNAEAITGSFTPEEVLEKLLAGTGLQYEVTKDSVVLIRGREVGAAKGMSQNEGEILRLSQSSQNSGDESSGSSSSSKEDLLEEIVVTAQKREERAIDVPMSITAISGERLSASGINNTLALATLVPSLAVSETGPGRQIIAIRGINNLRGSSSLTGVYLDELPVSGAQDGFLPSYADMRVIDLERVEVLKGPQGTLFGEGAAGGVIRFITKDPNLSQLGAEIASRVYNTADGEWSEAINGVVNLPIAQGVFGLRIAAAYENISGWIDQPSTGREDINDGKVKHVRVKALYTLTPQLKIKGMMEIHRNDGGGSNIVNQEPQEDSNFLQAFDVNGPTGFTDEYDLYNLTASYDFGSAELLSSTSYANFDSVQRFTQLVGQAPVPWLQIVTRYGQEANIFSQELRLASSGDERFEWTLGAVYKDAEMVLANGGLDARLFGDTFVLQGLNAGTRDTKTSESMAAFADVSYKVLDRLEVGGGLRYFYDERSGFDPTLPELATVSDHFDSLTYRAFLKFEAMQDVNLYVNLGTGFRSGGTNIASQVLLGAPSQYGVEELISYEAGVKASLFDGRVRANAALFYSEYQDMVEDVLILPATGGTPVQYTGNGQDADLKGFEWDVGWSVTDRLTLTFAGNLIDSQITWLDPANLQPKYVLGDPINMVPDYQLIAGLDHEFQWSAAVPGFFRLSFNRQGKSYSTSRNNGLLIETQTSAPATDFLNASIGGEWNGWELSLFGSNLLDERRIINASTNGFTAQARPRTLGVGLRKAF